MIQRSTGMRCSLHALLSSKAHSALFETHSQHRYCLPLRTQPYGAARKASHACLRSHCPVCYSRNSESEPVLDISNSYLNVSHTHCVFI